MKSGNGFVRTSTLSLKSLIDTATQLTTVGLPEKGQLHYCFQRWPHQVNGVKLLNTPKEEIASPIGSIFSRSWELRWRPLGNNYDVLLLSTQDVLKEFKSVGKVWHWCDRPAKFYPETETRLPKASSYPAKLNIAQRYFIDQKTAVVQFVALTF